jgi:hypothetical protein
MPTAYHQPPTANGQRSLPTVLEGPFVCNRFSKAILGKRIPPPSKD